MLREHITAAENAQKNTVWLKFSTRRSTFSDKALSLNFPSFCGFDALYFGEVFFH